MPGGAPRAGSQHFLTFLAVKRAATQPDQAFYNQWDSSPFADRYLTKLAETAVDQLGLGKSGGTGLSRSEAIQRLDHVGHGLKVPRSWEVQDMLVQLDKDLGELFSHLDAKVGRGNYVVALSADHGVAPIAEDMQKTGAYAGRLRIPEVQEKNCESARAIRL